MLSGKGKENLSFGAANSASKNDGFKRIPVKALIHLMQWLSTVIYLGAPVCLQKYDFTKHLQKRFLSSFRYTQVLLIMQNISNTFLCFYFPDCF